MTREKIEKRIHELLFERQGHLDKANGCAGAISVLQEQLGELIRDEQAASKKKK